MNYKGVRLSKWLPNILVQPYLKCFFEMSLMRLSCLGDHVRIGGVAFKLLANYRGRSTLFA